MTTASQSRINVRIIQVGEKRYQWALYKGFGELFLRSRRDFKSAESALSDARALLKRRRKAFGAVTYGVGEFAT